MKYIITEQQLNLLLKEEYKKLIIPPLVGPFHNSEMEKKDFDRILHFVQQGMTPYEAFGEAGFRIDWKERFDNYISTKQLETLASARQKYKRSVTPKKEKEKVEIENFIYNPDNITNPKHWVIRDMKPDETRINKLLYYSEDMDEFRNSLKTATIYDNPIEPVKYIIKKDSTRYKIMPVSDKDYEDSLKYSKNIPSGISSIRRIPYNKNTYGDRYKSGSDPY